MIAKLTRGAILLVVGAMVVAWCFSMAKSSASPPPRNDGPVGHLYC